MGQANGSTTSHFTSSFRPNILWLVAEDLGPIIPPFGDSTIATPNLSRLAAEGVRYPNVFSPSGVCAPSRAAIATGMYPTAIGAHNMRTGPWWGGRPADSVVAEVSSQMASYGAQAYEALPPREARMLSEYLRIENYFATNNRKQDYQFVAPATAWDENGADAHWLHRAPGQPFFAIFNFNVTHESRVWTKAEDSLLVPIDVEVPVPPYLPDTDVVRKDIRRVYSNVMEMDAAVGRRLDELESYGLLDSTIVVWYSDHGGPLPRQKRELYDSGIRVPMIIRYPGAWRAGTSDEQLISFVDLLPATLSLAGIASPDHVHGRAFEGQFVTKDQRMHIFAAADRFDEERDTRRAVRDARYKYIRNLHPDRSAYLPLAYRETMATMQEMLRMNTSGELSELQARWFAPTKPGEELYDTWTDPHETRNLAADSSMAAKLMDLRTALDLWQREYPDLGMINETEYIASIWPDSVQPRTPPPKGEVTDGLLVLSADSLGVLVGYRILPNDAPKSTGAGSWLIYRDPIPTLPGLRVLAFAHRIGFLPSETIEFAGTN
jgi:arylsulfatase A-like enzyme